MIQSVRVQCSVAMAVVMVEEVEEEERWHCFHPERSLSPMGEADEFVETGGKGGGNREVTKALPTLNPVNQG